MRRLEHWPRLLAEYVESRLQMPFKWVENDCCSFAAGAIEAMTGERPPLPAYADARQAAEALAAESLSSRVRSLYGPPIEPPFMQRGDLALFYVDGRETLAACIGGEIAAPGPGGLVAVPLSAAFAAWRV